MKTYGIKVDGRWYTGREEVEDCGPRIPEQIAGFHQHAGMFHGDLIDVPTFGDEPKRISGDTGLKSEIDFLLMRVRDNRIAFTSLEIVLLDLGETAVPNDALFGGRFTYQDLERIRHESPALANEVFELIRNGGLAGKPEQAVFDEVVAAIRQHTVSGTSPVVQAIVSRLTP